MFNSGADHYARNLKQAKSCAVAPATITKPNGEQTPAVVLFTMRQVRAVLPIPEALRLATEIADAADAHRSDFKHG
jgi:hypothetical protein